eukprot:Amastigsp_a845136_49.p6 type:complete len:138 gc:universal Amastigsp_a845136_49:1632-1219(-)
MSSSPDSASWAVTRVTTEADGGTRDRPPGCSRFAEQQNARYLRPLSCPSNCALNAASSTATASSARACSATASWSISAPASPLDSVRENETVRSRSPADAECDGDDVVDGDADAVNTADESSVEWPSSDCDSETSDA